MTAALRFPLFLACAALCACPTTQRPTDDDDDVPLDLFDAVPVGALVITEIQANPNVARPEYLEVVNATDADVLLTGCKIVDGGAGEHEHSITASDLVLAPGAYALMAGAESLGVLPQDLPADVTWTDITLAQSDPEEIVGLHCPDGTGARHVIDEVAFDWSSLDITRGHAWQLAVEPDADANDDPANWCEAPAEEEARYASLDGVPDYGSPGGPAICETPPEPTPSAEGDILITEILVDEFTGLREWFELHNPGDDPLDLRGCVLGDEPVDGSTDPNTHTLDADNGLTAIEAGGYLLLAKSGTDVVADESLVADYPYGSLGFNNSDPQLLTLDCPDEAAELVRIATLTYDWDAYGSDFEGRSLQLDDSGTGELCLAADDDAYWTTTDEEDAETFTAWGTPGAANRPCPVPEPAPAEGELVFTEIMVRSSAGVGHNEEWFEMLHAGAATVSLLGCSFVNGNADGEADEHVIEAPLGLSADPGDRLVFVKSSAADTIACGIGADYEYGTNLSFNNDDPETLALVCPGDVTVDAIAFDGGFLSGIPWQVRPGLEDADSNDLGDNWCSSENSDLYSWSCTVGDDTNYGTPGGPASCE